MFKCVRPSLKFKNFFLWSCSGLMAVWPVLVCKDEVKHQFKKCSEPSWDRAISRESTTKPGMSVFITAIHLKGETVQTSSYMSDFSFRTNWTQTLPVPVLKASEGLQLHTNTQDGTQQRQPHSPPRRKQKNFTNYLNDSYFLHSSIKLFSSLWMSPLSWF